MVIYKTNEEIELLRESNLLVSKTHGVISEYIQAGVQTRKLDKIAEEFIRDSGGIPGFLGYNGFPNTLCISINEEVVHGIPSKYELKEGDIASVDCGVLLNGFYGDSAFTFPIGEVNADVLKLMKVTKEALYLGIEKAVSNNRLGDVSFAIQEHVQKNGFSVVREMVGHGVGKELHEDPQVPNYGRRGQGMKLRDGLVIAIEPMINLGKRDIVQSSDGWTISTKDKQPSAHYEHTIAIVNGKADILSTFDFVKFKI